MHFAYEGFTHNGNKRCFRFRAIDGRDSVGLFSIEVMLVLFSQNRVPVQDGPRFCLQLLEAASTGEPNCLDRFRTYTVAPEDFRPLIQKREKELAEKVHKAPRRPFRKPSLGSNLSLGVPSLGR